MVAELKDSRRLKNHSSRYDKYIEIILLSVISSIIVAISMLAVYGETSYSVFAFHTNTTGGTTINNLEGLVTAIEARDHINAASQALLIDDNSMASLQLQLAKQVLSKFIGSGVWNVTMAGNGTAASTSGTTATSSSTSDTTATSPTGTPDTN